MQAIKPLFSRTFNLLQPTQRCFGVTWSELHQMDQRVRRKLSKLRMYTEHEDFTYEPPQMTYDKSTGDVTIIPKQVRKKPTVIQNLDDMEREKEALYKELGIESGDLEQEALKVDPENLSEVIYKAEKTIEADWDFDASKLNVFSRDGFRIDVGLMIMRPPIFLHMRDPDIELLKLRSRVMNEYYCDFKKYIKDYGEVTQLNESIYAENSYASQMNLDNYPTHEYTDPATGEVHQYCAASKNYAKVDPNCTDWRSIHYAAEDRTYFLVRNKYTQEWQFPMGEMFLGQTLLRGKQNLFMDMTSGTWRVKYSGNIP